MILSNTKYATSRTLFFTVLFATQCLSSHGFLRRQTDTVEEQVVSNCKSWCKNHEQSWDEKCKWQVNCAGCSECFDSSPEVMDFQHEEEEDELPCMNWCESHPSGWDEKCDWPLKCAGCSQCQSEVDLPHIEDPIDNPSPLSISVSMGCEVWCANHDTPWYDPGATGVGQKCSWLKNCGGCSECEQYLRCDDHCETNNDLPWVVPDDPDAVQKCTSRTCGGCVRCLLTAVDEDEDEDDTPTPTIAPSSIPSTSSIPTEDVLECRDWCNFVSPRLHLREIMNHAINFKELRRQERKKRLQKRMKNASEAETADIGVNQKKDGDKTPRGHENIQHNSDNVDHFFCDESHSVCSPHALRKLECDVGKQSQEGVSYINNFLSPEYTAALLHFLKRESSTMHNDCKSTYIDHVGKWTSLKHAKRRVLLLDSTIQAFPKPVQNIVDILQKLYPKEARINHVLINEYEAGQGILPHTDGPIYFPKTCTISMMSPCIFKFRTQSNSPSKMEVLLQDKSLIVFENDAYKNYLHGIDETFEEKISEKCHKFTSSFHNDVSIPLVGETITRSYRVSLTFRHKYPSKSAKNIK